MPDAAAARICLSRRRSRHRRPARHEAGPRPSGVPAPGRSVHRRGVHERRSAAGSPQRALRRSAGAFRRQARSAGDRGPDRVQARLGRTGEEHLAGRFPRDSRWCSAPSALRSGPARRTDGQPAEGAARRRRRRCLRLLRPGHRRHVADAEASRPDETASCRTRSTSSRSASRPASASTQRWSRLGEHLEGPLVEEFLLVLAELRIGESRSEALRKMADRVDIPELTSVVNSLIQAEQLGSPLGRMLRIQAEESRNRRQVAAEERAMKAPVKMLVPTALFIFPAMFVVILGPALLSSTRPSRDFEGGASRTSSGGPTLTRSSFCASDKHPRPIPAAHLSAEPRATSSSRGRTAGLSGAASSGRRRGARASAGRR